MYVEGPARVPGAVVWEACAWEAGGSRVVPDGCMDLLLWGGRLVVAGPDTTAQVGAARVGERIVGLRLAPGDGPRVLGVRAAELRDARVPLAELWPAAEVRRWTARAQAEGAAVLEEIARSRLAERPRCGASAPPAGLVPLLEAGAGVGEAAGRLGLGARTLHRRCLDAFGYGPRTLARILRMQRAWALLSQHGAPAAQVAHRTGYADQAHLAREFRTLAGAPVGALLAERGAASGLPGSG